MTLKASIALSCSFAIALICACPHNAQEITNPVSTSASDLCSDSGTSTFNFCSAGVDDTVNTTMQYNSNQQSSGQDGDSSSSSVDAQRALEAADSAPDPRALAYEEWARCKAPRPRVRCGKRAWTSTLTRG